jgi:hypothetical protein
MLKSKLLPKIEYQKFKLKLFKENLTRLRFDVNKILIDTFFDSKVIIYIIKYQIQKKDIFFLFD